MKWKGEKNIYLIHPPEMAEFQVVWNRNLDGDKTFVGP